MLTPPDVLNTYLVYLRYKPHTADLTQDAYNKAISEVIAMINAEKHERSHFLKFVEAWGKACGNEFLLS